MRWGPDVDSCHDRPARLAQNTSAPAECRRLSGVMDRRVSAVLCYVTSLRDGRTYEACWNAVYDGESCLAVSSWGNFIEIWMNDSRIEFVLMRFLPVR
jgi:hypothetical protein